MNENEIIEIIKKELEKYTDKKINSVNKKEDISVIGEDSITQKEIEKAFNISNESEKVIVLSLEINELTSISMATYINSKTEKIIDSLLQNKKVYIIEEGLTWRKYNSNNIALTKKYLKCEEELKKIGIQIVKKIEILEILNNNNKRKVYTKKVLTLRDVKELENKGIKTILISSKTFITELSQEYIKNSNLEIIKG